MRAILYLENGHIFEGESFGALGTSVGEIVFNTSLTGYQEIITDPSYAGQFITFTMTEIGNVGVNDDDAEARGVYCKGVVVRNYQDDYSNFRGTQSLGTFLKEKGIVAISGVDTRAITQIIRLEGAQQAVLSTEIFNKEELANIAKINPRIEEVNYIEQVSTKEAYKHTQGAWNDTHLNFNTQNLTTKNIVAIDFGAKLNILNELTEAGLNVSVVPNTFDVDALIADYNAGKVGGVFLSNGPGDPLVLTEEVAKIKKLLETDIPIFGICLGHQLLSIAHNYPTYKLKFGHHGGNHPVKNMQTGMVEITAQNHNYNVPDAITEIADVTHVNLFDDTIEGLAYKGKKVFSVQFHPESSPGPHESKYLFKQFADNVKECFA